MPSLSVYKSMLGRSGRTNGEVRKHQSDMIMEQTWNEDIQSRICYLYDWYHDDEPNKLRNLRPDKSRSKTPVDAKYIISSYQTMDKDQVTYHLQFRPSQECNVPYYDEVFGDKYDSVWPLGLYVDIPDSKGSFNRWLIVDKADYYAPQFSTYQILPCDHIFQWIFDGKKYEMPGVLRSQNSYNSGLWTDYMITTVEDQQKFLVPLNDITENLWYKQRMIIDAKVSTEPRAWEISKVNRISPNGLVRITLAQDHFDQLRDYVERDENNKIIGMWADYFSSTIEPAEEPVVETSRLTSKITYTGVKPQIKIGGNYKTFTVTFYDESGEETTYQNGTWSYFIKSKDTLTPVSALDKNPVLTKPGKSQNKIMIAFDKIDDYIKDILVVRHTAGTIVSEVEMEILGL